METILWAIDLIIVAGLCLWAVREDGGGKSTGKGRIMNGNRQRNEHRNEQTAINGNRQKRNGTDA